MKRTTTVMALGLMLIAACGGGAATGDPSGTEADAASPTTAGSATTAGAATGDGQVVAQQPPGQAMVSVDGREFTFDTTGPADCRIEPGSFSFSWIIGDNEVTLGGGGDVYDDDWLASIVLRLSNADGEPISYEPDRDHLNDGIAIAGDSFSYSGPMLIQPPNDGSAPPPEPVGDGTISATCG